MACKRRPALQCGCAREPPDAQRPEVVCIAGDAGHPVVVKTGFGRAQASATMSPRAPASPAPVPAQTRPSGSTLTARAKIAFLPLPPPLRALDGPMLPAFCFDGVHQATPLPVAAHTLPSWPVTSPLMTFEGRPLAVVSLTEAVPP